MTIWMASLPLELCQDGVQSWTPPEPNWKLMRRKRPMSLNLDPERFLRTDLHNKANIEINLYRFQNTLHPEASSAFFDVTGNKTSGPFSEEGFDAQNRLLCQLSLAATRQHSKRTNCVYWWYLPEGEAPDDEKNAGKGNRFINLSEVNYLRANITVFMNEARLKGMTPQEAADQRNQVASKVAQLPLLDEATRSLMIRLFEPGDGIHDVIRKTKDAMNERAERVKKMGRGLTDVQIFGG